MPNGTPTKEQVKEAMQDAEEMDLPDGAYWAMVHDLLGLEYGDVFDFITTDPAYFGWEETVTA